MKKFSSILTATHYTAFHKSKVTRGGGVSIYVKNTVKSTGQVYDAIEGVEIIHVYLQELKLYLYGVYRSPSVSASDFIISFDEVLSNAQTNSVIVGDMNLNLLETNNMQ